MNITCPHCQTRMNIADDKLPKDRDSSFKCPKCRDKILVKASELKAGEQSLPMEPEAASKTLAGFAGPGMKRAMICMADTIVKKKALAAIEQMGFEVDTPETISTAIRKMEYHVYPLVLADESFDQGRGLEKMSMHMNDLDMSIRRRICLVLMSSRFATGDHMASMHASVNTIVGTDAVEQLENVLVQALSEHEDFYLVYNESLKAVGKA